MEKYYNNIGTKIKEYAKFTGIIGGVISIITGFVVEAVLEFEFCGLCILAGVVSAIVNYVYSWFLYAFGQITDDLHDIKTSAKTEKKESYIIPNSDDKKESYTIPNSDDKKDFWVCKTCGIYNEPNKISCKNCGKYK